MTKNSITFIFLFFSIFDFQAQSGCTDPQALNFEPTAIENDGSCQYPPTEYQVTEITELPSALKEISGLAFFNDALWGQLDGGNDDEIYKIDSLTGEILHTTIIANAENIDWEDLAEDETHLYICDCGNNSGNRTDLRIYKVPKENMEMNVAFPEIIDFSLNDQTNFAPSNNDHNFDLEALLVLEDSIYIFSKNWQDFKTRQYVLPKVAGTFEAQLRDSLNVQGQVTSADITEDGEIVLMGYNISTTIGFFWLLFDFPDGQVFKGNKRKISLGTALNISQLEGITFRENGAGYIGAEEFSVLPPRLHKFNIAQWTDSLTNSVPNLKPEPEISVYPNPVNDYLKIETRNLQEKINSISIFNNLAEQVAEISLNNLGNQQNFEIDLSKYYLKSGIYFLQIVTKNRTFLRTISAQ